MHSNMYNLEALRRKKKKHLAKYKDINYPMENVRCGFH